MLTDKEDEYLYAKIDNMLAQANDKGRIIFTNFLTSGQLEFARRCTLNNKQVVFYGGHDDVLRVAMGVFPDYMDKTDITFPIVCLKVIYNKKFGSTLTHSDFLGALMGLSIKREMIGDIITYGDLGVTYIFIIESIKEYIAQNLTKVGSQSVIVSELGDTSSITITREFEEISKVISSLRLDCVVAMVTGKSRGRAAELIERSAIVVNSKEIQSLSSILKPEDVIVIKGMGKFILKNVQTTKKGRYLVSIFKYK